MKFYEDPVFWVLATLAAVFTVVRAYAQCKRQRNYLP